MDTNKDSLDSRDSWSKKRIKDIPRKSPPPAEKIYKIPEISLSAQREQAN